ncbi:MAG: 3-mercaptopyruvate sulfurtransferase [Janthinobacterium lividum]
MSGQDAGMGAGAMPPLVSTAWLAERLGDPGLVVLDASYFLPTEGRDARAEFAVTRVPGAGFFDIEAVADDDTPLPHMVPSAGRFARLVGALGVSDDSRVVFYDAKGLFSAARGWWLMRLFGHDAAAVLDGGLPKWRAEGRTVEDGPARVPEPGRFTPTLRAGLLRGTGDMLDNLASGEALVLDARSAGRFTGEAPEPRAGMAGGHIPGAASVPYSELLAADGTMLPPDALRRRLAEAGADGSRPVVTSCGTGVTAAVVSLALVVAGLPPGALYDGSWTEWAQRADTPKELGAGHRA